ncbi:kelch repeat protein [Stylonychia lemnae]|uniref:Kelch repeat protein n=1 Tax=Stylonychia lemnae TaxID=5949 RepID=A0A078B9D6_STYLE|nr:kelch repeat protein [Stylonychia lemnae]|eukprot:CDW90831.1 kelch repeat protein [Stylonychia lemnae]
MRSITFGPTSYFESSLNRNEDENEEDIQNNQHTSQERIQSQGHVSSSSQTTQRSNEVVFYSCDNLIRESLVAYRYKVLHKKLRSTNAKIDQKALHYRGVSSWLALETRHQFIETGILRNARERSEKFKVMLSNQMKETIESKIEIKNDEISPEVYKLLIQWIYVGECELPEQVQELIQLLKLTDEYLLPDLQKVCEEQIVDHMDCQSAVDILTNTQMVFPEVCDAPIRDAAKTVLLDDYDKIEEIYPDIEERISKVKGLMSEIFQHKRKRKTSHRKRKGSVLGEDSHKKKVRFNISNTIYEEASAIHDESDSLIEPLSIYSNSSPPGELNDDIMVSSTHSSLHALSYERRHSGSHANSQQLSSLITGSNHAHRNRPHIGNLSSEQRRSHEISNEVQMPTRVVMSPTSTRGLRPGSAGRNDNNNLQTFRSNSTTVLMNNDTDNQTNQPQRTQTQQSLFGRNNSDRFNSLI